MRTGQSKKKLLLSSILSVMLCIVMFLGSTLAWFTDSAVSANNRIEAGRLKVDLLMDKEENGNYVSINDEDEIGDIFSIAEDCNGILWEPNKTEIVFLQVENQESLALTYNIALEVTELNGQVKLAKSLKYAVIDGAKAADLSAVTSWTDIKNLTNVQLGNVTEGTMIAAPNGRLSSGESDYFALAVHMDEDAGTEYMKGGINIDVKVTATQATEEYDSFGNTYDKDALFEGMTDLIVNGDFEDVKADGTLEAWVYKYYADTDEIQVRSEAAESGANYLSLYSSTEDKYGHPYLEQVLLGYEAGTEVTFSAYVKKASETSVYPQVKFQFANAVSFLGAEDFTYKEATNTGWTKVESTFTIPEGTTEFAILVRNSAGAVGEVYWDNLQLTGYKGSDKNAALGSQFLAMLAEEDALKKLVPDPEAELGDNLDTTNRLTNGNLEENDGQNLFTGWTLLDVYQEIGSVAKNEGYNGTDGIRLKLATDADDDHDNPYYQQDIYNIVPGVTYQISYKYKWISGNCRPTLKIESYRNLDGGEPGPIVYVSGDNIAPETTQKDGEWHEVVGYFDFDENTEDARILMRILGNAASEYLFDDINVSMYSQPKVFDLVTDDTFYYTENQNGSATFKALINTKYHPDYADNQVDFKVYDEQTLVWESGKVTASEGLASVQFPLSLMTKQESPYRVIASAYNDEGKSVEVKSHDIFIYARPAYMTADGLYMIEGKADQIFNPVFGYHTYGEDDYAKAASGGINLFQIGKYDTADELLTELDMLKKYNAMGMVALYHGLRPAGAEQNIESTINVLNDERVLNHPSLFGYLVMDEPFLNITDPIPSMERSYRLIREIDDNHPILMVECKPEKFNITGGYTDILIIDEYQLAATKAVANTTSIAYKLFKNIKPIYTLVQTYDQNGIWPTGADLRNNNYQALITGADAIGYYSISDAWINAEDKKMAIWERDDSGELWNAISLFDNTEMPLAYAHFVRDESPCFNKDLSADSHWYYSWVVGNDIYMVVLGMVEGQATEVTIPLTSSNGQITIGEYTATVVAGEETGKTGNGSLNMTVDGVEAVLYKISPAATVDYSSLN